MANGNVINSVEHNGLSPYDYSNRQELAYYDNLQQNFSPVSDQTYLPFQYNQFRFDDYAGIFVISPPNPIIIPSEPAYNGIAPMKLMPTIDPPYPYDLVNNYDGY